MHGPSRQYESLPEDIKRQLSRIKTEIAPGENAPVVYQYKGHRLVSLMRWGMPPTWAKEPKTKYPTINARAETLTGSKRCVGLFKITSGLVPADGFFEWKPADGK